MTCPVLGWCYTSVPKRDGTRQDRRRCPECGGPGRRMGGTSSVMAEHRPETVEPPAGGPSTPPGPAEPSQAV